MFQRFIAVVIIEDVIYEIVYSCLVNNTFIEAMYSIWHLCMLNSSSKAEYAAFVIQINLFAIVAEYESLIVLDVQLVESIERRLYYWAGVDIYFIIIFKLRIYT